MLQRWKQILSNWINCYFNNSGNEAQSLNIESLITIISHLRENFNLDESKSSLLEAHTVEEFICEKYPEFKFENGTVQASDDEEVCLSASLLLFFVCVNSKNLDIKNAMCNKLGAGDQEIILKFSKCLMECPVITAGEVQSAITEACGQDIAAMDLARQYTVAETPPAMRSMHSNIRRLQAELEAERFDRNYLQDELARTNARLERLVKEKEQHKLEILSLKGKISLCSGDERSAKNKEEGTEVSEKMSRQIQQLELKLEETLTQLHDVQYEQDTLKAKMEQLKIDRDKWLALSQQENARVSQLSDELDTERRQNQSLKDLVAELRQHNRLNGLDTSSLECDDPEASIHSLHNTSNCSEACTNVVEVQLVEERAKIVVLQQQIQTLQAQISEINQIREVEKTTLQNAVAQRDIDVSDLKRRINEEIEKKNNMKAHCDNEITTLNNVIIELEQKLKESHDHSRATIEMKMQEIQTLQEEKLSLICSLNKETTKLEDVIKELQHELDIEKQTRSRIQETCENDLMKLNEKFLNRNNELVELQNNIFTKAEEIETLQIEIRNEKAAFAKLRTQYEALDEQKNTLQTDLQKERDAFINITNEYKIINEEKNSLRTEIIKEKQVFGELMNKYQKVNEEKDAIEKELTREQEVIKELSKNYQEIKEEHSTMESDLKKVKEAGKKLQNKYHTLHDNHKELKLEHSNDKKLINELTNKHEDLEKCYKTLQIQLEGKVKELEDLKHKYDEIAQQNRTMENKLKKENEVIEQLKNKYNKLEKENITIQTDLCKLKDSYEKLTSEYKDLVNQKTIIQDELQKKKQAFKELMQNYQNLIDHKNTIENELKLKCDDEQSLKLDLEAKVHSLKDKLTESEDLAEKLKKSYESQIENLNDMVTKLTNYLKNKTAELESIRMDKDILQQTVEDNSKVAEVQLGEERAKIVILQQQIQTLQAQINEINQIREAEKATLQNAVAQRENDVCDLKHRINEEIEKKNNLKAHCENEITKLNNEINELEQKLKENHDYSRDAIEKKLEEIQTLQEEKLSLIRSLNNETTKLENVIKELQHELDSEKQTRSRMKETYENHFMKLNEKVLNRNNELVELQNSIFIKAEEIETLQIEIRNEKEAFGKLKTQYAALNEQKNNLQTDFRKERDSFKKLINEYEIIKEEKKALQIDNGKEKEAFGELMNKYQKINEEKDAIEKELAREQEMIKELTKKYEEIKEEHNTMENDLKNVKEASRKLQNKYHTLHENHMELKSEHSNDKKMLHDLTNKHEDLEKCYKTLQIELEGKVKELEDLKHKYDDIAKQNELMENKLKKEKEVIEELKNKYNDLEKENITNQTDLCTLKDSYEKLTNNYKDIVNEKNIIQDELNKEKQAFTELMQNYQNLIEIKNMIENDLKLKCNEEQSLKLDLEAKVHSLKDKLTESEGLSEKLKKSHECQIENLNEMVTKLTNYLKEKTADLEALRMDKDILQQTVEDNHKVIEHLQEELLTEKENIDKITLEFESERQVLKNMVTVTESVMEDTKIGMNNEISELTKAKLALEEEKSKLKTLLNDMKLKFEAVEITNTSLLTLLKLVRNGKKDVEIESEIVREYLDQVIRDMNLERKSNATVIQSLEFQKQDLIEENLKLKRELTKAKLALEEEKSKLKTLNDVKLKFEAVEIANTSLLTLLKLVRNGKKDVEIESEIIREYLDQVIRDLNLERKSNATVIQSLELQKQDLIEENSKLKRAITNLEQLVKHELDENHKLRDEFDQQKLVLSNKCCILQDYQTKAEKVLEDRQKEIDTLQKEVQLLQNKIDLSEHDCKAKDGLISKMSKEKDAVISTISKELVEDKALREKLEKELQTQKSIVNELRNNMEITALKKENEQLIRAIGQQETFTAHSQEKAADRYACHQEPRDHQVDSTSSDNMHSSVESLKTITDLEKIIHDKNRTITTLQTDITYLKTLMAESETKLMDVTKELEISKDNAQQLSNQLKKIVYQKNEEIADLKKQVSKMSATENRATQIIKVSAKYQAMILKRIAEIKSNTVLKELQNFGNSENELRRSLNSGSVTMEDLENFLETTDRHLKRCAEKQIALQRERDRLAEVNRINESEIINLKKFLTELSVSFQTFSSVKELYAHKLIRVVSVQRTVRREILSLDGRISDATMCKLERGYGATMQDLAECAMNLERWVERCISRTVSVEKIKQAFTSDSERSSLASPSFQNTGLEIQLEELEKSFQKLLEEIARAVKNEGTTEPQAATVMEVRAEYEDKLNRMKAKMKDLFNEQMAILKNKQREEIELLERELQKTRNRMEDSKRAYESHIKELTKELWSVGEKYLVKNDEAEWLKKKQRSGSLMSLQHVHSSGLVSHQDIPSRPSDAHSLRSLPISDNHPKSKRDGRGLHMSDEEGEVFDNRCLKELAMTPRREPPGQRISELKWRNSLCPPHLKSSYPAETQFAPALDEDDLKAGASTAGVRPQRKEVGITAYKKPGPPTPSKQAGRLSATDSELRESLRVENDPHAHTERKTSTPARFRAFLRLSKHDSSDGTPRARRLSSIFRKKQ